MNKDTSALIAAVKAMTRHTVLLVHLDKDSGGKSNLEKASRRVLLKLNQPNTP